MTAPRPLLLDDDGQPYRRNDGRLVYLIQGGSSPAAPAAPSPATGQTPPPVPEAPPAAPAAPPVVPPGVTVAGTPSAVQPPQVPSWYSDGPEAAQAYVDRVVREAAGHRVGKNEIETNMQAAIEKAVSEAQGQWTQNIGKALGLVQDQEQLTPEQAAEQFAAKETGYQKQIRDLTMAGALSTALSGTHPGAKDALIGSGKLADLDPAAADFADQLKTRVAEYLDANPYLKVTTTAPLPQAGSSAADFTGSTTPPGGAPSIDDLRAERAKRRAG